MRSLGDQLKDIGLIDSQKLGQSDSPKSRKQGPSRNSDTTSKLILELPLLGRVTRIDEGRGFGFVAIDGGGEDLFFHLKGYAGRRAGAESLPPPNTPLLLITGSDRRRRAGREAVRWYPLVEVPVLADEPAIDQKMYDVLRRDRLNSMATDGLWRLLRAEWYCRQWENDAPADLDDPVLEAVWKARLREIDDNHLADGTFWDRLSHCRYEFAARLHPSHPRRAFDLDLFKPRQLAALGAPDPSWMQNADADLGSCCLAAGEQDVLVFGRQHGSPGDISQNLRDGLSASLIRLKIHDGMTDWVRADRAAHILDRRGGLQGFTTWRLPDELKRLPSTVGSAGSARINLATRRHHVLYPGALDQLGYWTEVLRTFRELSRREDRATPLLIIGSSESPELVKMLEVALAELGLGEVRPDHRGKREHLLRASRRGYAVVDILDNWPSWHGLAQSADIVLQPVIEALPLEEWFAYSQANGDRSALPQSPGDEAGKIEKSVEIRSFGIGAILEAMPSLVADYLAGWLVGHELCDGTLPAILIDPRLSGIGRELKAHVDVVLLHGTELSEDYLRRLDLVLSPFSLVREEAPTDFASMERFLVENWNPKDGTSRGVQGFKESQRSAMEAICDRTSNVLVSLPTGEGKSVLFQVPALSRGLRNRRLTLVISPLKALMRDQVEGLRDLGFAESADFLSGDRPKHEIEEVLQGVLDHRVVLLYVAPERLRSAVFLDVLDKRMRSDGGLDHVVIDEAHCVNQWGFEFRPDYFYATDLLLRKCREIAGAEPTPFLLLSATITASDKERLEAIVSGVDSDHRLPMLVRPETFAHPIRSHISILPRRVRGRIGQDDLERELAERLPIIEKAISDAKQNRLNTGQRSAVIVFVPTRRLAEDLARRLSDDSGTDAEFYHAGLDAATKEEVYADFRDGELDVLVATKAFGMGMDIPDIHWVVHTTSICWSTRGRGPARRLSWWGASFTSYASSTFIPHRLSCSHSIVR